MVTLRFFADLNDFLKEDQRGEEIRYELDKARSVKDLIESLGIPHTEIDIIVVNDRSVDFNYRVREDDVINAYPAFQRPEISPVIRLQARPDEPRFILDVHLGKLAAYMRMMGFDTLYRNDYDDPELAHISADEDRILLTCDRRLLMRKQVDYGYFVRNRSAKVQFAEVTQRYQLRGRYRPFSRCIDCNGLIKPVDKQRISSRLQSKTRQYYDDFYQCQNCHKIYWEGNHVMKMRRVIDELSG